MPPLHRRTTMEHGKIHSWQGSDMPRKQRKRAAVDLPPGVHRVVARAREYFYFQAGRGTSAEGPRVRLPNDPQTPEFWAALRTAQGLVHIEHIQTYGEVLDAYETSPQFLNLGYGTKKTYRRGMRISREAWGKLPAADLRPVHVMALMDALSTVPGTANTVLGVIRAISSWGRARDHFKHSISEGVKPYAKEGGHKPWTPQQLASAEKHLTGFVRRAFFLARYTGQRGSDVTRLGETYIDEGGFRLAQQKTGREIWCPIDDALSVEMATWERRPGPYVHFENGNPISRSILDKHFKIQRDKIPALVGTTLHGLRSTRVVELRRFGLTSSQIQDQVGMSLAMIERYCRFADKKANGKASVIALKERRRNDGL